MYGFAGKSYIYLSIETNMEYVIILSAIFVTYKTNKISRDQDLRSRRQKVRSRRHA